MSTVHICTNGGHFGFSHSGCACIADLFPQIKEIAPLFSVENSQKEFQALLITQGDVHVRSVVGREKACQELYVFTLHMENSCFFISGQTGTSRLKCIIFSRKTLKGV
jgi:hypothetical protein